MGCQYKLSNGLSDGTGKNIQLAFPDALDISKTIGNEDCEIKMVRKSKYVFILCQDRTVCADATLNDYFAKFTYQSSF